MPWFLRSELYSEDCQCFEPVEEQEEEEEDDFFFPDSIDCPKCSSEAYRKGKDNWYTCSNDDCGWEGTFDDA